MQFTIIALIGLAAFATAAPQDASSVTAAAASATSAEEVSASTAPPSPIQSCVTACDNDICCQAKCVGVPCPNEASANSTTECAAKCVQGDGTEEQTAKYAACQSDCINNNFFSQSAGAAGATGTTGDDSASATGSSGSSKATASDAASSASSSAESAASSASQSAASASASNAAGGIQVGVSTAGMLGLLMAALAL